MLERHLGPSAPSCDGSQLSAAGHAKTLALPVSAQPVPAVSLPSPGHSKTGAFTRGSRKHPGSFNGQTSDELGALAPQLAWHFEQAGLADRAAACHLQAGKRAAQLAAHEDAISHLTRGLALLEALPNSPERARLKLDLHLAAVTPFSMARGFWCPERIHALEHAHRISQHPALGDSPERLEVLAAMAYFALWSAQPERTLEFGEQVLRLAERNQDQQHVLLAHSLLGCALTLRVELAMARDHLDKALDGYDRRSCRQPNMVLGIHVDVMSLGLQATASWLLGYPDQASRYLEEALVAARDSKHAGTLGFVQSVSSILLFLLGRDPEAARQQVEALRLLSEKGLPLEAWAGSLSNWGPASNGRDETTLQRMRHDNETFRAQGTGIGCGAQFLHLARGYALAGQVNVGLDTLNEVLDWINQTGIRLVEAEVHRLRGELLLMDKPFEEDAVRAAEACFRTSIAIARRQHARWWELRATVSLCRLLKEHDATPSESCAAAREMLAEIYGWFGEGFDMLDLQEARELLEELGS